MLQVQQILSPLTAQVGMGKDHCAPASFLQVHSIETSIIEPAYIKLLAEKKKIAMKNVKKMR